MAVVFRGDDPPYPPMSVRPGLIAKTAIVSGPPAPTTSPLWGDVWCPRKSPLRGDPPYPRCRGAWRNLVRVTRACAVTDSLGSV